MTEMKATINMRISHDMNASFSFTTLVEEHEDAAQFGDQCALMVHHWVAGFGAADIPEGAE